jgi:hypothetical protein
LLESACTLRTPVTKQKCGPLALGTRRFIIRAYLLAALAFGIVTFIFPNSEVQAKRTKEVKTVQRGLKCVNLTTF